MLIKKSMVYIAFLIGILGVVIYPRVGYANGPYMKLGSSLVSQGVTVQQNEGRTGVDFRIGYPISRLVSVDVGYMHQLGHASLAYDEASRVNDIVDVSTQIYLSPLSYLGIGSREHFLSVVGVGVATLFEGESTDRQATIRVVPELLIGMESRWSDHFIVHLGMRVMPTISRGHSMMAMSFGLGWQF